MRLKVTMETSALDRVFGRIEERLQDLRPPLTELGPDVLSEMRERFDREGPGWKKNAGRNPVGYKTGKLAESFEKGQPGNVFSVGPDGAAFGSNVPYAQIFQEGGETILPTGKVVRMPARPIVRNPSKDLMGDEVARYLGGA